MFSFLQQLGSQSNKALQDVLQNDPFLLDVRTKGEFAAGSAKGATNIPLDALPRQLKKVPKDKTIVVFCQSGGRSAQAAQILQSSGFSDVVNGGGVRSVRNALNQAS